MFAFSFVDGNPTPLPSLGAVDQVPEPVDFVWVHLDLRDAAGEDWLRRQAWPDHVTDLLLPRAAHGRMYADDDLLYGHLRDLREQSGLALPHDGVLSIVVAQDRVVTGCHQPLRAVHQLCERIADGRVRLARPAAWPAAFLRTLNDIGDDLLLQGFDGLNAIERRILRRRGDKERQALLKIRRETLHVVRDMASHRAAMTEVVRQLRPPLFADGDIRQFQHQVHRYLALVEDTHRYAEHAQLLVEELRSQVAESTNRKLYLLTILSTAFLPPTLVASFWGMNVHGIPFSEVPHGFWVVAGLTATLWGGLFWALKRFGQL